MRPDGTRHGQYAIWLLILSSENPIDTPAALQRWSGCEYRDGQKHGEWTSWEEKGRKRVGSFQNGKKHGKLTYSDWEGMVSKVEEYEHDALMNTIQYNNGKPITE